MANNTWPDTLPQYFTVDGFSNQLPTGAIRVEMDSGPVFQRQRYTASVEPIQCSIELTKDQYQIFKDFYIVALAQGTLPFNCTHPITKETVEMQFDVSSPPKISVSQNSSASFGTIFRVDMNLEVLP